MKKTGYSVIAMIVLGLTGCASGAAKAPVAASVSPPTSPTVYRPAPVQPDWCVAMRSFKANSDQALSEGDLDRVMLSMAALEPYNESPGVLQVITDVFSLYEATSGTSVLPQTDYGKLKSDETKSLAVCP